MIKRIVLRTLCLLVIGTLLISCSSFNSSSGEIEFSTVNEKLELGMTKAEVKSIFGRAYTSLEATVDGREVWRYDSVAEEGYIVARVKGQELVDRYDRSGLLSGKLSSQLFISWNDEHVVNDAYVYYMADGMLHEYHIQDGQRD